LPEYLYLARQQRQYNQLLKSLQKGQNLLIIEIDGPHQESLPYYQANYGVSSDFIQNDTMLATPGNLQIMLNDTKHAFGHGYCLAWGLDADLTDTYLSSMNRIYDDVQ
jgi:hypothetical protein